MSVFMIASGGSELELRAVTCQNRQGAETLAGLEALTSRTAVAGELHLSEMVSGTENTLQPVLNSLAVCRSGPGSAA